MVNQVVSATYLVKVNLSWSINVAVSLYDITTIQVHWVVLTMDLNSLQGSTVLVPMCCYLHPSCFPINPVLVFVYIYCNTIPFVTSVNCMLVFSHSGLQAAVCFTSVFCSRWHHSTSYTTSFCFSEGSAVIVASWSSVVWTQPLLQELHMPSPDSCWCCGCAMCGIFWQFIWLVFIFWAHEWCGSDRVFFTSSSGKSLMTCTMPR